MYLTRYIVPYTVLDAMAGCEEVPVAEAHAFEFAKRFLLIDGSDRSQPVVRDIKLVTR